MQTASEIEDKISNLIYGVRVAFSLSLKDKKVIAAFVDKESLEGRLLSTDGRSLVKHGFGGEKVAVWRYDKIAVVSGESTKSDDVIIRALVKEAGKYLVTFRYRNKGHEQSIRFEYWDDAVDRNQYTYVIRAYAWDNTLMGFLRYDRYRDPLTKKNEYSVNMVEVRPEYRRSGVATALYREMFKREGITKRDLKESMQTEEGSKFRQML